MVIEQAVQLRSERCERTGLDLDQFTVGSHQVDHPTAHRHFGAVARTRELLLERGVQRPLAEFTDAHNL